VSRPVLGLAVILLVGGTADRLFSGGVAVPLMIAVGVMVPVLMVTVRTVRRDARMNAQLGAAWRRKVAEQATGTLSAGSERGAA
jgi:hypothetical protein